MIKIYTKSFTPPFTPVGRKVNVPLLKLIQSTSLTSVNVPIDEATKFVADCPKFVFDPNSFCICFCNLGCILIK